MFVVKHLMQNHSQRVDVTFVCVDGFSLSVVEENLRSHSVGGATFLTEDGQFRSNRFSKAKIGDFDCAIFEENVLKLEVPVNDVFLVEVVHSLYDLIKVVYFLIDVNIWKGFPQISIAKFQSNVVLLFMVPELVQSDDVW